MTKKEQKTTPGFLGFVLMAAAWTAGIAFLFGFAVHKVAELGYEKGGQFGDSFGLLNACAAIFAAIMLVRALHTQMREFELMRKEFKLMRKEYKESKKQLERSADAQNSLLEQTIQGNKIAGLTALLNHSIRDHDLIREEMKSVSDECESIEQRIEMYSAKDNDVGLDEVERENLECLYSLQGNVEKRDGMLDRLESLIRIKIDLVSSQLASSCGLDAYSTSEEEILKDIERDKEEYEEPASDQSDTKS